MADIDLCQQTIGGWPHPLPLQHWALIISRNSKGNEMDQFQMKVSAAKWYPVLLLFLALRSSSRDSDFCLVNFDFYAVWMVINFQVFSKDVFGCFFIQVTLHRETNIVTFFSILKTFLRITIFNQQNIAKYCNIHKVYQSISK